jgi:Glycosyl transferases group 1
MQIYSMQASRFSKNNASKPMRRVAIGVPLDSPWNEMSAMVVDSCQQLGIDAYAVDDGDETAFDADALILLGSGRWYPRFESMSRRLGHRRPQIVLWHLQPLPPPVFTRRANELGQKLLRGQWDDLFGAWLKPLSKYLPVSGHGRLVFQRLLGVQVLSEFERIGGPDYGNVGWDDLKMIFEEAAWLAEQWAQPDPWIDEVAADTPTRVAFLQQHGIPARFIPMGFHDGWGCENHGERDVDVMVFGNIHTGTRANIIPQVLSKLEDWGYRTEVQPLFPMTSLRISLLQRARIVLNVLRMPWEFTGLRLFPSTACGALMVSNTAVQNEPFVEGLHFVPAPKARMAEAIANLLDHEEERARRAAIAKHDLRQNFSMQHSVASLLHVGAMQSMVLRAA